MTLPPTTSLSRCCRVPGLSKQAFNKWHANPVTQRDWDGAHLIHAAREIHHDDPGFGYRYIRDELVEQGILASRNRNRSTSSGQLIPAITEQSPRSRWVG